MTYKNLVFKGGGAKIFCSVGAVKALEEYGVLDGIERVAGSSAGSVLALLVSLNMSAAEIESYLVNFDMAAEMRNGNIEVETDRFFNEFGRYSGEDIIRQTAELLISKTGNKDITFKQLHNMGFKDLYITATDLTNNKTIVYSYEDTPNAKVLDAVHISSIYPLYFTPVIGPNGEVLLDGGLLNNYPINIFDGPDGYNPETLGIYLGDRHENGAIIGGLSDVVNLVDPFNNMDPNRIKECLAALDFDGFDTDSTEIKDLVSYIKMLLIVGKSAANHSHHPDGEIFINLNGLQVATFDLELSEDERLKLIQHGFDQALRFINFDDNGNLLIQGGAPIRLVDHNEQGAVPTQHDEGNSYFDYVNMGYFI